jgi:hypothetical protein
MGIKSIKWEDGAGWSTLVDECGKPILFYTTDDDGVHCLPEYKNMIAAAPDMWVIIKQLIDTKQITDDQWAAMDEIAARIDR